MANSEQIQAIIDMGLQNSLSPDRKRKLDEMIRRGFYVLPDGANGSTEIRTIEEIQTIANLGLYSFFTDKKKRKIEEFASRGLITIPFVNFEERKIRESLQEAVGRGDESAELDARGKLEKFNSRVNAPRIPGAGTSAPDLEGPSVASGTASSLLQGATLGFSDEIQSVISAAIGAPFISDKTFGQLVTDARKSSREDQDRFREENPVASFGLELAGGAATGGLIAGGIKKGVKALALQGAKLGGLAGAGFSDSDEFISMDTLVDQLTGAALGTTFSVLTPAVVKGIASSRKLIPKVIPEKMLETVMKFRPSIANSTRAQMTRTALDQGILPTVKGLNKVADKITDLDLRLNRMIDTATADGATIPKSSLFSNIGKVRKDFGGIKVNGARDIAIINNVIKSLHEQIKKTKKNRLTPREVQDLKTRAYKSINFDLRVGSASEPRNEARKAIARSAKESLEKINPGIKVTNRELGSLLELQDELERTVSRLDNRNLISLDSAAKLAAGAASGLGVGASTGSASAGAVGTGVGFTAAVLGAPRIKARIALGLENLRKAGEISSRAQAQLSPGAAKAIAVLVGKTQESIRNAVLVENDE